VIGMALLFVGLVLRGNLPAGLGGVADGLLGSLSLLFVPAGVGVMQHAGLIGSELLPLSAALVVSTVVAVGVTGVVMSWLGGRSVPGGRGRQEGG
jgi:holin-like protein